MRYIKTFLILLVAMVGLSSVNVFAQKDNLSRQAIEKKISKEINMLPYYGVFDNITFKFDGSTVTLGGKTVRAVNKSSIKNIVEDIDGVQNVVNNIEVLPLSNFDDQIRIQTLQAFATRGGNLGRYIQEPKPDVRIIVENGRVSLEGKVANRTDVNLATILTKGVFGVFDVMNNLIVTNERVG